MQQAARSDRPSGRVTTTRIVPCLATALLLALTAIPAAAETLVVTAERMLDVREGRLVSPAVLVVTDGVIESVNPSSPPGDAEVVDLGDRTLLPGLIDMHSHLTLDFFTGDDWTTATVKQTAPDWALMGAKFAAETLGTGFTTARDLGAFPGFPDVALMRAIDGGYVPGPDIWPAGHAISITGGHCDQTGFAPGIMELGPKQGVADGVDEVIKAVRYQAKHGVRVIKVCATGGVFSFSQSAPVGAQQYSAAELEAIVEEARKLGLKVAAHAHGTEGIIAAVRAGVDSIEHGSILDEEAIGLMKERGTFLVPQAYINENTLPPETPQATRDKEEYLRPLVRRSFTMAFEEGVNMAFGSDSGVFAHGEVGREFGALVRMGLPEDHVLRMATVYAAELLGVDDRGELAAGKRADIVAVDGDPLADITVMESVPFVMKRGAVVKRP